MCWSCTFGTICCALLWVLLQAQNQDSFLIKRGNVTRAIDSQWGLISLDWDLSLRLAVTVGVVDGSLRHSESRVADPYGYQRKRDWEKGDLGVDDDYTDAPTSVPTILPTQDHSTIPSTGPSPAPSVPSSVPSQLPTLSPTALPSATPTMAPTASYNPSFAPSPVPSMVPSAQPSPSPSPGPTSVPTSAPTNATYASFASGGGSGRGAATGEVEAYSDVLWLNQGADRYCDLA